MKKKKKNYFLISLTILFGIYISLYIASVNGYYEYTMHNKMSLTKEAMEKFENDVSQGKNVNINDYIEKSVDYSNSVSKFGYNSGLIIENGVNNTIDYIFKVIGKLVTD